MERTNAALCVCNHETVMTFDALNEFLKSYSLLAWLTFGFAASGALDFVLASNENKRCRYQPVRTFNTPIYPMGRACQRDIQPDI